MLTSYILWHIRPEVFPGLAIPRWYGLCWAAGIWLSVYVMHRIFKADDRPAEEVDKLTLYLIIGTLAGARLGHVLFYDPVYYWHNPVEILPVSLHPTLHFTGFAGLASHGGGLGVLLAAYLFACKYRISYLWLLDRLAIIAPLCGAFIRLGNLVNSEMVGTPTDVPWAFIFPAVDALPRHPAQLYEAIYCIILFVLAYQFWKHRRHSWQQGTLTGLFLLILFTLRFIDEFVKVNQEAFEDGMWLNMGQLLSLPYILAGLYLLLRRNHRSTILPPVN